MGPDGMPDAARLAAWLAETVDPDVSSVDVHRLAGGYSSGAWRVDAVRRGEPRSMVLKAPQMPSVVHRRDAAREGRILDALSRMGAPVPAILAIDRGERAVGRPCFLMEFVDGRSISDPMPGSYYDDPWLRDAGVDVQRAVWDSFHDALAALHCADATKVPDAAHGPHGVTDVVDYWRDALLDAAPAPTVPRQLAVLEWLRANVPPGGDDAPSVCMGDARLVNCIVDGTDVRALVDFEVAYMGNPAADIGYSLFVDDRMRSGSSHTLPGLPSHAETWERWARATGRSIEHRDYWTAFGATIIVITATRAMIQWGMPRSSIETDNMLVTPWEAAVQRARTR
jgi:aminoglycoside phosphotransferase (APT) family kinase protein